MKNVLAKLKTSRSAPYPNINDTWFNIEQICTVLNDHYAAIGGTEILLPHNNNPTSVSVWGVMHALVKKTPEK